MQQKRPVIAAIAIFSLALMYVPSLAVAAFSVNDAIYGLTWRGGTLKWYERLFHNEYVLDAAVNTLIVAAASTAVATVLGTALALGLYRVLVGRRPEGYRRGHQYPAGRARHYHGRGPGLGL